MCLHESSRGFTMAQTFLQEVEQAQSNGKVFQERHTKNQFKWINSISMCSLACRYDNPIPIRFLAPVDCLKIPAQDCHWPAEDLGNTAVGDLQNPGYVTGSGSRVCQLNWTWQVNTVWYQLNIGGQFGRLNWTLKVNLVSSTKPSRSFQLNWTLKVYLLGSTEHGRSIWSARLNIRGQYGQLDWTLEVNMVSSTEHWRSIYSAQLNTIDLDRSTEHLKVNLVRSTEHGRSIWWAQLKIGD